MNIREKAERLIYDAHKGQFRRYTNEPFVVHPLAVAQLVSYVTDDEATIVAALLHDVIEDTTVTKEMIEAGFGLEISALVSEVTNVTKKSDGNREWRKAREREHLAVASPRAKTIKLADILDNVPSIIKYDPGFARIYVVEKKALLEFLAEGNESLYFDAKRLIDDFVC
jgi:(p)ppGpp synthase/HD superfamily hydrolase